MLKRYSVKEDPPRKIDNVPLTGGLQLILNMGIIAMALGVLAGVSGLIPGSPTGVKIGMMGFGLGVIAFGYMIYRSGKKKVDARADALRNGFVVEGRVVNKGRKFNPFSSWQYYMITVKFEDGEHRLVSTKEQLHELFDEGDTVMGFRSPSTGNLFFPAEAGIEVDLLDEEGGLS